MKNVRYAFILGLLLFIPFINTNAKEYNVVGIGDSIMSGYGLANPKTDAFVELSEDYLEKLFINETDVVVNNIAIGGTDTKQLLERLVNANGKYNKENEIIKNADLIEISIGGNDGLLAISATILDNTVVSCEFSMNEIKKAMSDVEDVAAIKVATQLYGADCVDDYATNSVAQNANSLDDIYKHANTEKEIPMMKLMSMLSGSKLIACANDSSYSVHSECKEIVEKQASGEAIQESEMGNVISEGLGIDFFALVKSQIPQILKTDFSALTEEGGIIYNNMQGLASRWEAILTEIRKLNPKARVVALNGYNPYRALEGILNLKIVKMFIDFDLIETVSYMQDKANSVVEDKKYKDKYDYEIIDVKSSIDTLLGGFTYTGAIKMDPHPNKKGHKKIHEILTKYYKTIKLDLDGDGSDGEIDIDIDIEIPAISSSKYKKGDLNHDGVIDEKDVAEFEKLNLDGQTSWEDSANLSAEEKTDRSIADIDGNGIVDEIDFNLMKNCNGKTDCGGEVVIDDDTGKVVDENAIPIEKPDVPPVEEPDVPPVEDPSIGDVDLSKSKVVVEKIVEAAKKISEIGKKIFSWFSGK